MDFKAVVDGISCLSMRSVALAVRRPSQLRRYIGQCLRTYDELVGNGLPARHPITPAEAMTVTIPVYHSGGGMSFDELVYLARTVRVLQPRTIFEMGSYNGLTTAVFILNSDPTAEVLTLDLPPGSGETPLLSSDRELIASRSLVSTTKTLGLSRYTQLLCDSMKFDPAPYADTVDLGLIDAAHDLIHVQNDTVKMARMMSSRGIVFWHDYGGKGSLRPLASYLEGLAKTCPLYRIRGTTLAWGPAAELKSALGGMRPAACANVNDSAADAMKLRNAGRRSA
jgi:hypothetical protein